MALVFSGTSVKGRQVYTAALTNGTSYIMLFPDKPSTAVRFEGTWEVLSLNTPLGEYVQKAAIDLWVRSHITPAGIITNNTHRFAVVWRYDGISFQVHTT